jgi:hypothetical protein
MWRRYDGRLASSIGSVLGDDSAAELVRDEAIVQWV